MPRWTSSRSGGRPRRMRRASAAVVLAGSLAAVSACGGSEMEMDGAAAAPSSPSQAAAPPSGESPAQSSAQSSAPAGEQEAGTVEAQLVDFAIELGQDSFTAGSVEFAVVNEGDASHDFVVERDGENVAATEILSPGDSATLPVDLEPGTYVVYCSVGAHRSMGMEITIEVI